MIYNRLRNSEADFNEIVNEEILEQNLLEEDISKLLDEIKAKNEKIEGVSQEAADKDDKIAKLNKGLKEAELKLKFKMASLPFGSTYNSAIGGLNNVYIPSYGGSVIKTFLETKEKHESK